MRGHGTAGWRRKAARWLVLAALILGVTGIPSPAHAATSWWTTTDGLGGDQASITAVDELVATHDVRPMLLYRVSTTLRARVQSASGVWSAPTDLFTSAVSEAPEATTVVTADATYVVWSDGISQIDAARLDGDTWTHLPALELDGSIRHFDAAATPEGDVAVAWSETRMYDQDLVGTATFDGSAWSEQSTSELDGLWVGIVLVVAPDGTRVVALNGKAGAGGLIGYPDVYGLTHDGSGWSAPQLLSVAGGYLHRANIAATSDGAALVFRDNTILGQSDVRVATFGGGSWDARAITTMGMNVSDPVLAVTPEGTARVAVVVNSVWPERWSQIRTFEHTGSGNWSGPSTAITIPPVDPNAYSLGMAIGPDGTEVVTTSLYDLINPSLVAGLRGPGKPWQDPIVLGDLSAVADLHQMVDADGVVHLVWKTGTGWWNASGIVVPFDDIVPGAFYSWPVLWAYDVGLTTGVGGTDEFQPNRSITRAEAITTLWRFAGSPPAPPAGFDDVGGGTFYSAAVDWARDVGLTTGVGGTNRFEPNRTITRAELVTLLWRLDGMESAPPGGFVDVPPGAFFEASVNWAKAAGITTGVGGSNRFEPNRQVTRAEAFTFVYRLAASMDVSAASGGDSQLGPLELQQPIPLD